MGDSHVGLQARLMSQALRKLTGGLSQTNTTMIFINQLREKIGVFFGSPETTAGGKALKFYASVRLDIRRIETLKDGTEAVGNRTRVKVVKNKMAPPFKQAEFDILYGVGISREGSLIDFGVEHGIVKKSGAWYTYEGDQLGQGKENSRNFLIANPDIAAEIESKIKIKLGIVADPNAVAAKRRRTSARSKRSCRRARALSVTVACRRRSSWRRSFRRVRERREWGLSRDGSSASAGASRSGDASPATPRLRRGAGDGQPSRATVARRSSDCVVAGRDAPRRPAESKRAARLRRCPTAVEQHLGCETPAHERRTAAEEDEETARQTRKTSERRHPSARTAGHVAVGTRAGARSARDRHRRSRSELDRLEASG